MDEDDECFGSKNIILLSYNDNAQLRPLSSNMMMIHKIFTLQKRGICICTIVLNA